MYFFNFSTVNNRKEILKSCQFQVIDVLVVRGSRNCSDFYGVNLNKINRLIFKSIY